jgi:hypothetical protein
MRFVVVGVPDDRRLKQFGDAVARRGWPAPRLVPYRDLLPGGAGWGTALESAGAVRIESPGGDFALERELIALGAGADDDRSLLSAAEASALDYDHGRIRHGRQWYVGFRSVLARIEAELARWPRIRRTSSPAEIAVQCDKAACQERLDAHSVPIAPPLGVVRSHEELIERLELWGTTRAFLKPRHGSSASGVLAYRGTGDREQVTTSVELVRGVDGIALYNSLRVRTYSRREDVRDLVDVLGTDGLWVERWIPKASVAGHAFDVRMLVVAGRARHTMLRLSRSPLTNLHLGNRRGDPALLTAVGGAAAIDRLHEAAEAAARAFPLSLHEGVDLLIAPGHRRVAVLEVNAFGDLLPGWLHDGQETYDAELDAVAA